MTDALSERNLNSLSKQIVCSLQIQTIKLFKKCIFKLKTLSKWHNMWCTQIHKLSSCIHHSSFSIIIIITIAKGCAINKWTKKKRCLNEIWDGHSFITIKFRFDFGWTAQNCMRMILSAKIFFIHLCKLLSHNLRSQSMDCCWIQFYAVCFSFGLTTHKKKKKYFGRENWHCHNLVTFGIVHAEFK